jgi:16S rRNA (cytosine967-C5)-methyltransferase
VASVMARHPELIELPIEHRGKYMTRGRPFGTVIWPGLPWIDGFYLALLSKRK